MDDFFLDVTPSPTNPIMFVTVEASLVAPRPS